MITEETDRYLVGSNPRAKDALDQLGILPRLRGVFDVEGKQHRTNRVCPRHILAPPAYQPPVGRVNGTFHCGVCGRRLVKRSTYTLDLERRAAWEEAVG